MYKTQSIFKSHEMWKLEKNLSEDVQSALETLIPGYVSFSQFFKDYVVDR